MSDGKKGFAQHLRDRHVLRVAVLYLGAAWVALEFIGFVVDNYSLHRALLDASLFVLVVGFLIAVVIAWYHGGEGRQPVTGRENGTSRPHRNPA